MSPEAPSTVVMLTNVRISFPTLLNPEASFKDGPLKYSADFLLTPDHPGIGQFFQIVNSLAAEKWKEQAAAVLQMIGNERKFRCYGRGEERLHQKKMVPYDGYPGMIYISALSDTQPVMIQPDGSPVDARNTMAIQAEIRKIYGGCYVNAAIKPFLQNNEAGRAVRCELIAIQFFADGQPFGEGPIDLTGMFAAVPGAAAQGGMSGMPGMPQPQFAPQQQPAPQAWPQQQPQFAPQQQQPVPQAWPQPQGGMPPAPAYTQQGPPQPQQGVPQQPAFGGMPLPTGNAPLPGGF